MKTKTISAAIGLLAATLLAALTPQQDYTSDCSQAPVKRSLTFVQGGSQKLGWTFKQGSTAKDLTGATLITFLYAPTTRAWSQVVTGALDVATNGSVLITFTAAQLNTNSTTLGAFDWLLSVDDADETLAYAYGKLTLVADPSGGVTNTFPTTTTTVDWSDVAAYSSGSDYGPVRPDWTTITATTNADGSLTFATAATTVTSLTGDTEFVVTGSGHAITGSIGSAIARDTEVQAATQSVHVTISAEIDSDITAATGACATAWAAADLAATQAVASALTSAYQAADVAATGALYTTSAAGWAASDVLATGALHTTISAEIDSDITTATGACATAWAAADTAVSNYYAESITNVTGAGINAAIKSGRIVTVTGTEADTLATACGRGASYSNASGNTIVTFQNSNAGQMSVMDLIGTYNTFLRLRPQVSGSRKTAGIGIFDDALDDWLWWLLGDCDGNGTQTFGLYDAVNGAYRWTVGTDGVVNAPSGFSENGTALSEKYYGIANPSNWVTASVTNGLENATHAADTYVPLSGWTVTQPWVVAPNILATNQYGWNQWVCHDLPFTGGFTNWKVTAFDTVTVTGYYSDAQVAITNIPVQWTEFGGLTGSITQDTTAVDWAMPLGRRFAMIVYGPSSATNVAITGYGTNRISLTP